MSCTNVIVACLLGMCSVEFSGCGLTRAEQTLAFLEGNVAKLTYEQAHHRWGAPKAVAEGDESFDAVWRLERVRILSNQSVLVFGGLFVAVPISHGEQFTLTFNKQNSTMVKWRYETW